MENGAAEIEYARDNQGKPEASQMYSLISIAINLKRIADANETDTRDYFAGLALQGMIAHEVVRPSEAAEKAFQFADAMMTARQRR